MTFQQKYPEAFEDDKGTVWTCKAAADPADWDLVHGDAFMEDILGWSLAEAEENYALSVQIEAQKAFWRSHPRLRAFCEFVRRRCGFTSLFLRTVWRDFYGRISWATAWKIAGDLWLR